MLMINMIHEDSEWIHSYKMKIGDLFLKQEYKVKYLMDTFTLFLFFHTVLLLFFFFYI